MKKKISVLALASMFAAGSAMASGWRIPEQSVDSTAKAGANIASSTRADAAYYNPANMSWLDDTFQLQLDASWIHLMEIDYDDNRPVPALDGHSESEDFFVPTGFMVSPSYGGVRVGLAITAPYGLSKKWKGIYQKSFAEEFTLEVIEVNPTISYSVGKVSFAAGPRMLYANAKVKSDARQAFSQGLFPAPLTRDMEDSTIEWGWNVALSVKPIDSLNLSATYRSNVDLGFEDGDARITLANGTPAVLAAAVTVPAPAVLALSAAYDVRDNFNVELTWDRTFWSKYKQLDFDFTPAVSPAILNPLEAPVPKDWDDTNAIRLGLTWDVNNSWTLMGGIAWDENPAPAKNIGFELPDSNAWLFSLGTQYKVTENLDIGLAALYDYKQSRKVKSAPSATGSIAIDGEFTDAAALLVTAGINYKF